MYFHHKLIKKHKKYKQFWAIEALYRDNFSCTNCQKNCDEAILVVHHIDESRKLGIKNMNNNLDNLLTLCKKCHALIHGQVKQRTEIIQYINKGLTYAEIGKIFNISRQRVHQLYKSAILL